MRYSNKYGSNRYYYNATKGIVNSFFAVSRTYKESQNGTRFSKMRIEATHQR